MPGRVVVCALVLLAAGCGSGDGGDRGADGSGRGGADPTTEVPAPSPDTERSASPLPSRRAAGGVVVTTRGSRFGTMLFDGAGQAIYLFDKETTRRPECYGGCAAAWPPVLSRGQPRARGEVRPGLLGTVRRGDGSRQVTYGGHPLYYYAHEQPGQVLCHDVAEYGGVWLVVTPTGRAAPA